MTTETRTCYGETATQALKGWSGFRVGQRYELVYTQEFDELIIQPPHAPSRDKRVSKAEFERWFRK